MRSARRVKVDGTVLAVKFVKTEPTMDEQIDMICEDIAHKYLAKRDQLDLGRRIIARRDQNLAKREQQRRRSMDEISPEVIKHVTKHRIAQPSAASHERTALNFEEGA